MSSLLLKIKVKFGADRNSLQKISEGEYNAFLSEAPVNNQANIALVKLLSKQFKISHTKIDIKNGMSRKKIVEIKL